MLTASPRSAAARSPSAISPVSRPRRRWVGATVTAVTPSAGTVRPPGTVSSKGTVRNEPTHVPPSKAPQARLRSGRIRSSQKSARACSAWGDCGGARKVARMVRR